MTSSNLGEIPPSPPPPAAVAKPSPLTRMVGVIIAPKETFASIARQPDWVVPVLTIALISFACSILISLRIDFTALARETMEMNPQMANVPADRLETAVKFTAVTMRISTYSAAILVTLALVIVAAVLLLSFRLFGGDGTFKQAFSATAYAWIPRFVKGILATIVLLSKSSISIFDLQNPLMSNLGFLFDPRKQPLQFALASSIDVFSIWTVVLLVIGFSEVFRISRGKSAAIVVGWWIVINLLALIGPAMQAMRG